jgi:signal transduction histidine kinase
MPMMIIVAASICLQLLAAVMAIRLTRLTGRLLAWILIAAALVLQAMRRIIPMWHMLFGHGSIPQDTLSETIGCVLSLFMAVGIARIGPFFSAVKRAETELRLSNEDLEARIAERTVELKRSNERLNFELVERKAAEERLIRAERLAAVGTLTAGIAHQFNNINTVSLGFLQFLEEESSLTARSQRYIDAVREAINREVDITSRLLLLSSHPPAAEIPPVLTGDVVRAVLSCLRPDIEAEGVTLTVELKDTRLVSIAGTQLDFVVRALLDNARHALLEQPRREMRVETMDDGEEICLCVIDTGIGISQEDRLSIFVPFFSTKGEHAPPGSPQARVRGMGLSLTVLHAVVTCYGGKIGVESTPGVGSTFTVRLPVWNVS